MTDTSAFTPPSSRLGRLIHEVSRGSRAHSAVVFALVFKDLRLDAMRSRLGLVWALIEPMVQMSIFAGLWRPTGVTTIGGAPIVLFLACGVIPYLAVRQAISTIGSAMRRSESLFDYPQVKPFDTVVASFIYEMTVLLLASIIFIFVYQWFTGITPAYHQPLPALYIVGLLLCLCLGVALCLGTYVTLYDDLTRIVGWMPRALMFLSALFYSLNQLPASARWLLSWNPLAQINEHLRFYILGAPLFPEASLTYTTLTCLLFLGAGFIVYAANRFKLIQK